VVRAGACRRLPARDVEDVEVVAAPGSWLLGPGGGGGPARTAVLERGAAGSRTRSGEVPRAVLLSLRRVGGPGRDDDAQDAGGSSLEELARLADTDGLSVVGELTQARERPDPATWRSW
jgi:GTP-binding protein HflX